MAPVVQSVKKAATQEEEDSLIPPPLDPAQALKETSADDDDDDDDDTPPANQIEPQSLFTMTAADIQAAARILDRSVDDHPTPQHILTAFLEPVDYDNWFIQQPLPNRSSTPAQSRAPCVQGPSFGRAFPPLSTAVPASR